MVNVVDNSFYGFGYREINQQLAKENGELRQQNGELRQMVSNFQIETSQQRGEIHKRDEQINELRSQLTNIETKLNVIKDVVLDRKPIETLRRCHASSIHPIEESSRHGGPNLTFSGVDNGNSTPLPLQSASQLEVESSPLQSTLAPQTDQGAASSPESSPESSRASSTSTSYNSADEHTDRLIATQLERISEHSEEEDEDGNHLANTVQNSAATEVVDRDSQSTFNDSLCPPNLTCVTPLQLNPEKTMGTPSIWNCLDPIELPGARFSKQSNETEAQAAETEENQEPRGDDDILDIQPTTESKRKSCLVESKANRTKRLPNKKVKRKVVYDEPATEPQVAAQAESQEPEEQSQPSSGRYNLRKRKKA